MKIDTQIPAGYKQSVLGFIPKEWHVVNLGEIFEFKNGINASKESYGTGIKFINVMEVIYNNVITSKIIPGTIQIEESQKQLYSVKNGDVLFNRTSETTNEIGLSSVYLDSELVVFGGFVIRGRSVDKSLVDNFKKFCFRSDALRRQIIKGGQGAVRSNIGQGDLEKIKLLVPPLSEQKAIADLLSTWDRAIDLTSKLIAKKEQRKKWLVQQLITGKKRLRGFTQRWKIQKLGDFLIERDTKSIIPNEFEILTSSRRGLIYQKEYFKKQVASEDNTGYKVILKGDFTYRSMSDDATFVFNQLDFAENGLISPAYAVFYLEGINDKYLKYLINSYSFRRYVNREIQGGTRVAFRFSSLAEVRLPIPSISEQAVIAEVLDTADKELQLLQQQLDRLREQKKGLMQQLLTGKKRIA